MSRNTIRRSYFVYSFKSPAVREAAVHMLLSVLELDGFFAAVVEFRTLCRTLPLPRHALLNVDWNQVRVHASLFRDTSQKHLK
jgi:hypothetical protein